MLRDGATLGGNADHRNKLGPMSAMFPAAPGSGWGNGVD